MHRAGETTIGDSPWEDTTKVGLVRFIKNGIETRIALRRLDRHKETVIVMLTTETERRIVQSVSSYKWQRLCRQRAVEGDGGKTGGLSQGQLSLVIFFQQPAPERVVAMHGVDLARSVVQRPPFVIPPEYSPA